MKFSPSERPEETNSRRRREGCKLFGHDLSSDFLSLPRNPPPKKCTRKRDVRFLAKQAGFPSFLLLSADLISRITHRWVSGFVYGGVYGVMCEIWDTVACESIGTFLEILYVCIIQNILNPIYDVTKRGYHMITLVKFETDLNIYRGVTKYLLEAYTWQRSPK